MLESRLPSRTNGLNLPLHPLQFLVLFVLIYFGLIWNCVTVPALPTVWQPAGYTILAVILISHVITYAVATIIDPADEMISHRLVKGTSASLDRSIHKHAIENNFCYLCECMVGDKSKHCSICNKCVEVFDHHCVWLNNCVGRKNYRTFIACLFTGLMGSVIIGSINLMLFIAYFTDKNRGDILQPYAELLKTSTESQVSTVTTGTAQFYLFFRPAPYEAFLAIVALTTVMGFIASGLLVHLLGFHVYLWFKKLTTYELIIQEREKADLEAQRKASNPSIQEREEQATTSTSCLKSVKPKRSIVPVSTTSMKELQQKQKTEYSLV